MIVRASSDILKLYQVFPPPSLFKKERGNNMRIDQKDLHNQVRTTFLLASTRKSAQEGAKLPAAKRSISLKGIDFRLPTKPETNGSKKTDCLLITDHLKASRWRKLGKAFRKGPCSKRRTVLFLSDALFCQKFLDDFGYECFIGFAIQHLHRKFHRILQ